MPTETPVKPDMLEELWELPEVDEPKPGPKCHTAIATVHAHTYRKGFFRRKQTEFHLEDPRTCQNRATVWIDSKCLRCKNLLVEPVCDYHLNIAKSGGRVCAMCLPEVVGIMVVGIKPI